MNFNLNIAIFHTPSDTENSNKKSNAINIININAGTVSLSTVS